MEIITSTKNEIIVQTKKIKEKPDGNLLFLENPKIIKEAYLNNIKFEYVLICDERQKHLNEEYPFLFNFKFFLVSVNVLNGLSETSTPQGVVAVVNFKPKSLQIPKGNFLVLENLQDPGNLGTIIRSASGTNFKDIFLINCVNICNQKLLRSSMGNIFKVNLYTFKTTEEFLDFSNQNKLNLFRADLNGENLFEMKKPKFNYGVVVGNEGNGLSNLMKENITKAIAIPMKNDLESLNAGVSCSIILYYLDNLK